jgi:hypothetical protein
VSECHYHEGCVVGCIADVTEGTVILDTWGCGAGKQSTVELSPDEARAEAQALLAAADYVEFGPGEWRDGEWHLDHRIPPSSLTAGNEAA